MTNRRLCFNGDFKVRADPTTDENTGKRYIEGYFVVYNTEVEIFPGYFEQIAPGAVNDSIKSNDIRCLFNHDTGFVLGRTGNNTVTLKSDNIGLYATVEVNQNDRQAMDVYERVKRGDISTCSFGFFEEASEQETEECGLVLHNKVTKADVFEISICPFPAYEDTEISARSSIVNKNAKKQIEIRKATLKKRLEVLKNAETN